MNDSDAKAVFYQTLAAVPFGYYTSYGRLADVCGVHVRQIQAWLRTLPCESELPWFRIINSQRKITPHAGAERQHRKLANEVLLPDKRGRYPLDKYWPDCLDKLPVPPPGGTHY